MKTLKFYLIFPLIMSAQLSFSQQQIIVLSQHTLKIDKVIIGSSYNGMAPYNPDKNAEYDKVLAIELIISKGSPKIKFGEGEFKTWLTDDINNKTTDKDEVIMTKDKTITYLFNVSGKASSFKMHFGDSITVDLKPAI